MVNRAATAAATALEVERAAQRVPARVARVASGPMAAEAAVPVSPAAGVAMAVSARPAEPGQRPLAAMVAQAEPDWCHPAAEAEAVVPMARSRPALQPTTQRSPVATVAKVGMAVAFSAAAAAAVRVVTG